MQLVLSDKRIIAHGNNFIAMGGTVICLDTGAVFQNATIAECDCCPSDIDSVGYEYHAGVFVPCAPYGIGTGNLAVWGDKCKTPLDSGIKLSDNGLKFATSIFATLKSSVSVTANFSPKFVIIVPRELSRTDLGGGTYNFPVTIATPNIAVAIYSGGSLATRTVTVSENTITINNNTNYYWGDIDIIVFG